MGCSTPEQRLAAGSSAKGQHTPRSPRREGCKKVSPAGEVTYRQGTPYKQIYGETATTDEIPEVWFRVTVGVPR